MAGPNPNHWCPYKKRECGRQHTQREDGMKTQEEGAIYESRREFSEETSPGDSLAVQWLGLCTFTVRAGVPFLVEQLRSHKQHVAGPKRRKTETSPADTLTLNF